MKTTYFKVDRDIQNNWLWEDKPFSRGQAWIDLLLLATHTDRKDFRRGKVIYKKRGEVHCSIGFLCKRWGWSKTKLLHFFDTLKNEEMIITKSTTQGTIVFIEKYAFYQGEYLTKMQTKMQTEVQAEVQTEVQTEVLQTKREKKEKELSIINKKGETCNPIFDRRLAALREKIRKNNDDWREEHDTKRFNN